MVSDPTGYSINDGTYSLSNWSFQYQNGQRRVPNAASMAETIFFVGDSITFGWGVNDEDTWVNLVAQELQIDAVNLGRNCYSILNYDIVLKTLPENACIVLLWVNNDHLPPTFYNPSSQSNNSSMLTKLISVLTITPNPNPDENFYTLVDQIIQDPRIISVAFEDDWSERLNGQIIRIPKYTSRISFTDAHPDALGNQQIAQAITPHIQALLLTRECSPLK